MFATANWCLAVVQGTVWSWLPSGFPSPAIRPMANGGGCPRSLRWGHGGPLGESRVVFCLGAGTEPTALVGRHRVSGVASSLPVSGSWSRLQCWSMSWPSRDGRLLAGLVWAPILTSVRYR